MCTTSRTTSPWHNFVSDTAHWVDSTGATPFINNGEIYPSVSNNAFMATLKVLLELSGYTAPLLI